MGSAEVAEGLERVGVHDDEVGCETFLYPSRDFSPAEDSALVCVAAWSA